MDYFFKPITESTAREILLWKYEPPYDIYNLNAEDVEAELAWYLNPENHFHSIYNKNQELVGVCSFGEDGRVKGGDYSREAIDIGAGLRPNLTGQGNGAGFLEAILLFTKEKFPDQTLRATVASFNQRCITVCERSGFRQTQEFVRDSNPPEVFKVFVIEA